LELGGLLSADGGYIDANQGLEIAYPTLQGEYFHAFTNGQVNANFWGYYVSGSFFLTGEHRCYDTSNGVFTSIKPNYLPFCY
jgi:phosphate-selective porin